MACAQSKNRSLGVSVVVCTFNGSPRIRAVLEALAASKIETPAEVILVDNNSTDDVANKASAIWQECGRKDIDLRIVLETEQGQAYARRAGVLACKHELVVFCDDDNLLAEDYLSVATEILRDDTVGAAGGCGTPIFDGEPSPEFFTYASYFAVGAQIRTPDDLCKEVVDLSESHDHVLYGAGLVARRADLLNFYRLPFFPLVSGRKGRDLSSHDDHELCHLVSLAGKRLIYTPRLSFKHLMPKSRLCPEKIQGQLKATEISRRRVSKYVAMRRLRTMSSSAIVKEGLRCLLDLLTGRPNRNRIFMLCAALNCGFALDADERKVFDNCRSLTSLVSEPATSLTQHKANAIA